MSGKQLRKAKLKSIRDYDECVYRKQCLRYRKRVRPGQQNKSEVDEVEGSRYLQNRVIANCKKLNKMGREMTAFEEVDPRQPSALPSIKCGKMQKANSSEEMLDLVSLVVQLMGNPKEGKAWKFQAYFWQS